MPFSIVADLAQVCSIVIVGLVHHEKTKQNFAVTSQGDQKRKE